MTENLHIPEEFRSTFQRLVYKLPEERRDDINLLETILAFLKLGGKNLATQFVETVMHPFEERVVLFRRQPSKLEESQENMGKDEDRGDKDTEDT